MSAADTAPLAPRLAQSVRWGEHYVSCALNAKFAGVIKPGIYRGFVLKPAGVMSVRVENGDACRSVAVVERDGYSITVVMLDGGEIKIPMRGIWYICVEALYTPAQPGYQRIVATESVESHHVVIGRVTVTEIGAEITTDMITSEDREQSEIASMDDIDGLWAAIHGLMDNGDGTTLPERWNSLKKVGFTLGRVESIVDGFFHNEGGGDGGEGQPPVDLASLQLSLAALKAALASLADRKESVWELEKGQLEGEDLALPVSYIPGIHALALSWDGLRLHPGVNFQEQGEVGKPSSVVKLLFPAHAGSEFSAHVLAGAVDIVPPDVLDLLAEATLRANAAAAKAEEAAENIGDPIRVTPL